MTPILAKLDELKALANAATPGPWKADFGNWQIESENQDTYRDGVCTFTFDDRDRCDGSTNPVDPASDADFIAASRTAMPQLVEALRVAEGHIKSSCTCDPEFPKPLCAACETLIRIQALICGESV
jgi:hypothetical protein